MLLHDNSGSTFSHISKKIIHEMQELSTLRHKLDQDVQGLRVEFQDLREKIRSQLDETAGLADRVGQSFLVIFTLIAISFPFLLPLSLAKEQEQEKRQKILKLVNYLDTLLLINKLCQIEFSERSTK